MPATGQLAVDDETSVITPLPDALTAFEALRTRSHHEGTHRAEAVAAVRLAASHT